MKKTLFLRIFLGYAAVAAILVAGVEIFAPPAMRDHHIQERRAALTHLALVLETPILPSLAGGTAGDLAGLVTSISRETATRITVIDRDGNVLADSEREPRDMENHLFRPEIQAALRGETQMSIRPSSTLKTEMMYLSVPLQTGGRIVGALRLSSYMKDFETLMAALRADLLGVLALAAAVALALAFFLTRSLTAPLREVMDASRRVAAGDFDVSVSTRRSGEFREFARSFNAMSGRLKGMFGEIRLQNEEIRGILASIREGLCVIDGKARIVICNEPFRRLAGGEPPEGRPFWEVLRSSAAAEAVRQARSNGRTATAEAEIGGNMFAIEAAPLCESGCLIVTLSSVGRPDGALTPR